MIRIVKPTARPRANCAIAVQPVRFFKSLCAAGLLACSMFASDATASVGCAADIDGNHLTDVNDLLSVINGWGSCAGGPLLCPMDVAPAGGNGVVDVNDLLTIINNWGACACNPANGCITATRLFCEDFELGNYTRWTAGYSASGPCRSSVFAGDRSVSPGKSNRSQVTCVNTADSHRGYGGLRFQGDTILSSFTIPSSGGINAPNGVIVSFWMWLSVPYDLSPSKWLSLLTVTNDCSNDWTDVVTVNIDDSTRRLKPVHVNTVNYAAGAPAMPLQQWARVTVYINYYTGSLHIWQNGAKVANATFTRPNNTMCQWHWGLYASGNNDNITLYEDDIRIYKLQQPLTNFTVEPWIPGSGVSCTP